MKEITVFFDTAREIWEFARFANRQPYPIYIKQGKNLFDARSILNLSCVGLRHPLTLCLERAEDAERFFAGT